jgi:hypothetical protein
MPKIANLTQANTQSATPAIDSPRTESAVDSKGRTITVAQLSFYQMHLLTLMLGGEDASNSRAVGQAALAASVVKIDNADVRWPTSRLQLDHLMSRLDHHGVEAASIASAKFNPSPAIDEAA